MPQNYKQLEKNGEKKENRKDREIDRNRENRNKIETKGISSENGKTDKKLSTK